jgi:CarD family transcriptional regulator
VKSSAKRAASTKAKPATAKRGASARRSGAARTAPAPARKTASASTTTPSRTAKPSAPPPAKVIAPSPVTASATASSTSVSPPPRAPTPSSPPPAAARANGHGFMPSNGRSHANGSPAYTNGYVPPPMAPFKPVHFKVGDKAVHPSHGVGEVTAIEQRDIGGAKQMFYVLRILDNGMKVMVPTGAAQQVGLRVIMSEKEANTILTTMKAREVAVDVQPWSRRFRVYTEMIKSGSPGEVAKVLRDMNRLKFDKDLSFGERRLLDQAKSLLLKELAFAKKKSETEMAEEIRSIFSA